MTGDEYFIGFLHSGRLNCRLAFSFFCQCAIDFARKRSIEGIEIALGLAATSFVSLGAKPVRDRDS